MMHGVLFLNTWKWKIRHNQDHENKIQNEKWKLKEIFVNNIELRIKNY